MISVVVPAYNCELYLDQAIKSVQAQTVQDFEVIIVDDCSTDNTFQLAKQLAHNDSRIKVLTQENSGGPSKPRNEGITHSQGEYICFLDPDDYWYPTKLEKQLNIMNAYPEIAMVFCELDRVDAGGNTMGAAYLERVNYLQKAREYLIYAGGDLYLSKPNFYAFSSVQIVGPTSSSVMLRRSTLEKQAEWFPLDLLVGEDIDLWFRIIQSEKAAYINESLCAYRQHSTSLMHNLPRVTIGLIAAHSRNFERVHQSLSDRQKKVCRGRIANHYADLGYREWLKLDMSAARLAYANSLKWQLKFKVAISYAKTALPKSLVVFLRKTLSPYDDEKIILKK